MVDTTRVAVMGMSDGASMAISMALRNPSVFQAALVQATGFFIRPTFMPPEVPRPQIFMEHGTGDRLFDIRSIALPNREQLLSLGCRVEFRAVEAGHMVRAEFFDDALAFWCALPRNRCRNANGV